MKGSTHSTRALTPRQERFVAEYLVDLNATQAAVRAGYSVKTAASIGYENLRKPEIASAITMRKAQQLNKAEVSAERILRELARIAHADIRELFDAEGHLKPTADLSDDAAAAVSSIEVVTRTRGDEEVEQVRKVRSWDKTRALDILAKHLGLLKQTHEHSGPGGGSISVDWSTLTREELTARAEALVARLKAETT